VAVEAMDLSQDDIAPDPNKDYLARRLPNGGVPFDLIKGVHHCRPDLLLQEGNPASVLTSYFLFFTSD
jgi:hypothetical protein